MKRIIGAVLSVVMAVSLLTVTAEAGTISNFAKPLKSGVSQKVFLTDELTDNVFSVTLAEKGDLTIETEGSTCRSTFIIVIKEDFTGPKTSTQKATCGSWYGENEPTAEYDLNMLVWDNNLKKASGTLVYKNVEKGTYYILFNTSEYGYGTCTIKAAYPDGKSSSAEGVIKDVTLQIPMKKGDTLKLGAILSPTNAVGTATWTSNKTSVATVSSTGKIKAKAAGTATIPAQSAEKERIYGLKSVKS